VTATPTQDPATTNNNNNNQPTQTAATTQNAQTTQGKSSAAPATTNKASNTQATPVAGQGSTALTVVTASESLLTDGSAGTSAVSAGTTTTSTAGKGSSGGFSGIKGGQVGMAVGIVVGIAGGFLLIVLGIYFWRRHRRRQQMERLGSMEELTRAPSPPLLSRSLTRGANGPRQPIDDDDDDFLTPMDTMPNTHRMDDYGHHEDQSGGYYTDNKSVYGGDEYYENEHSGAPQLPPAFPVLPPAAVVPANGRFYSGDFTQLRPTTSGSTTAGGQANTNIPSYSSMNKYTAYTPGAAVNNNNNNNNPSYGSGPGAAVTSNNRTSSYSTVSSFSRPGAGYRTYDNNHNNYGDNNHNNYGGGYM
jgi:hypothetical protein